MRKKWNIVVYRTIISILLLFNTMFFQIINTTVLAAGTVIDAKITQLQLLTDSGTPATAVAKSATIRMKFDFETPSTMMNKDDYFDIAIPPLCQVLDTYFFKFPINFFYSILTLKLDFSRACLSGLHILLGQLLPKSL